MNHVDMIYGVKNFTLKRVTELKIKIKSNTLKVTYQSKHQKPHLTLTHHNSMFQHKIYKAIHENLFLLLLLQDAQFFHGGDRSCIKLSEHCDPTLDPMGLWPRGIQLHFHDKVCGVAGRGKDTPPVTCLVQWAKVVWVD